MTITQHISIDLQQPGNAPMIHAVQGDEYTRVVEIDLYSGGVAWNPPDGCEVAIRYGKPDGKGGIYDALPDNTPAYSIEGNVATVTLAPQMVTVPGVVEVQVSIIKDRKDRISTFSFAVNVEADPSKGELKSENYVNWKTYYIPQTTGATVGHFLQISKVDATGRILEVVPVENPAGEATNKAYEALRIANDVAQEIKDYSPSGTRSIAEAAMRKASERLVAPPSASVGQYFRVKEVDANGVVTAVEAVDAPSGGGGSGEDGATFFPSVSDDGTLSWTNDKELPNPEPVNIKGPKGKDGTSPVKGTDYFTEADKEDFFADVAAVRYVAQALTEAQKAQARANIGAAGKNESAVNFQTIAHRGYHVSAAQNSLQSFIDAANAGFEWVEMDIRYCADGVYVLSHDPTITAYNNGTAVSVTIAESNYSDIKNYTLDADGIYPICTFATALATLRNYGVKIICDRSGGTNAEMVEIAARLGMADKIMLSYQYPGKPFLDHELPVLKKYKTIPIRIVPTQYESMEKAMNELDNPIYADVNASSEEHYQTCLNIAMSCGAPILFSGCTLTDNNKKRWAGIACGGMAHDNANISPEEFISAITADYAERSAITVSAAALTIEANETVEVTANSDLVTAAGCLFVYSRNPLVATVTQTSFGQNIGFTVTGSNLSGYSTEIVVFSPNGEQITIPVSIGETVDATLVYELESPVTFTASGVDQVIDTGYALNAVDRDWTIAFEFVPKANINSTLWSCADETTGSATLNAGHQFRVSYSNNYYYVNGGMNSSKINLTSLSPQNDTTVYKVVVTHTASTNTLKCNYTDADGNVVSPSAFTWTEDNDVRNSQTLLIGGRYGTDGNIYGSTTSSLWQGTVNDFKIYERVFTAAEIAAYLA